MIKSKKFLKFPKKFPKNVKLSGTPISPAVEFRLRRQASISKIFGNMGYFGYTPCTPLAHPLHTLVIYLLFSHIKPYFNSNKFYSNIRIQVFNIALQYIVKPIQDRFAKNLKLALDFAEKLMT